MKKILYSVLFFGLVFSFTNFVFADTSNISKLVFITEPQTIAPNTVSKYITLQIQDVSGNQVSALETIRFDAFQTTSATGIFVSCTTPANPPTDYLSKNGSNKNICYKDTTEGVYTITAKTNNTSNSLVATQTITISSGTTPPDDDTSTTTATSTNTTATTTASTTTPVNTTSSGGSSYYVYSSSASLSTYEPVSLSVDAGRERLGFLHVPLRFKAYAGDRKTGKSVSGAKYSWTFGDGASGDGSEIDHTYLFTGEYNVVLNSSSGDEDAVDITKVKIVSPQIKMTANDSYLEFINENNFDLNIGEWKILGNEREYLIPKDTILSALGSIKISNSLLAEVYVGGKISLVYPDNQTAQEIVFVIGSEKQKLISELSQKLLAIQNEFYVAYENENNSINLAGRERELSLDINDGDGTAQESDEGKAKEGSVANAISSPVSKSVVSKIVDFFATMFR